MYDAIKISKAKGLFVKGYQQTDYYTTENIIKTCGEGKKKEIKCLSANSWINQMK